MKKFTVAMVRERLSDALDSALSGEPVFIERKGVTYRLSVEYAKKPRKTRKPMIEVLDPAVLEGQWTWDWVDGQLPFRARSQSASRKRR
jgi:antitoxin (DNA-binding transcriptional repressor) of toxin-antitoxin stability system